MDLGCKNQKPNITVAGDDKGCRTDVGEGRAGVPGGLQSKRNSKCKKNYFLPFIVNWF
jgi:hypothetical protein